MNNLKHIKKEIIPIIFILIFLMAGMYAYKYLPAVVPTHWDANNTPNGWSTRNFAVFFFPGLIFGIYLLLSLFPHIDPFKENMKKFSGVYYKFKLVLILFMGGIYLLTLYAALNHNINVGRFVMIGIAWFIYYIALILPLLKRNYFIGIRLPWTLASDEVWDKTHKFGKQVFIILAFLILINSFFSGSLIFWLFLIEMFIGVMSLCVYSYIQFRKCK